MDNLSATLQSVLSDPQSMAQIQNIMSSLSMGGAQAAPVAPPAPAVPAAPTAPAAAMPNLDMLSSLLPAMGGGTQQNALMPALLRAAPLLTAANQEDDATRLLQALRPLLGEARRKKLDEAARILKLLRLLPLLRETGILKNIL